MSSVAPCHTQLLKHSLFSPCHGFGFEHEVLFTHVFSHRETAKLHSLEESVKKAIKEEKKTVLASTSKVLKSAEESKKEADKAIAFSAEEAKKLSKDFDDKVRFGWLSRYVCGVVCGVWCVVCGVWCVVTCFFLALLESTLLGVSFSFFSFSFCTLNSHSLVDLGVLDRFLSADQCSDQGSCERTGSRAS